MLKPFFVSSLLWCLSTLTMFAQTSPASDSTTIRWEGKWSTPKERFQPIPKKAIMYSAILPGLGQVYNRQYWKLPLVAGAFITLGLIANFNHERYMKYRDFYYIVSPHTEDPSYVPPSTVAVPYEDGVIRDLDVNQLKRLNDGFRRNRDYTFIGIAVAWAFNVVDANVSLLGAIGKDVFMIKA